MPCNELCRDFWVVRDEADVFCIDQQGWWEYGEREFRAWELVTTSAPGNSGKIDALVAQAW